MNSLVFEYKEERSWGNFFLRKKKRFTRLLSHYNSKCPFGSKLVFRNSKIFLWSASRLTSSRRALGLGCRRRRECQGLGAERGGLQFGDQIRLENEMKFFAS